MENDAQRVILFASTLEGLVFDSFDKWPEGSVQTFHDLKTTFERNFSDETHRVPRKTLLETYQKEEESAKY